MNDSRATMRESSASAPVLIFAIGGLVPFVGLAAMIEFGPATWYVYWLAALSYYGAVILAFVGALHWGYALRRHARGRDAWVQYGCSIAMALIAWLSLLIPVWTALRLQAIGLLVCYGVDRVMARADPVPAWFLQLRAVLTAVGAASLIFASWV
jgi:Protein of unknown function (DUF3429)